MVKLKLQMGENKCILHISVGVSILYIYIFFKGQIYKSFLFCVHALTQTVLPDFQSNKTLIGNVEDCYR